MSKDRNKTMLSENDYKFLNKRKRFINSWNIAATIILLLLGTAFLWIFFKSPYIANPIYVVEAIKQNTIENSVLITATALLPFIVIFLFVIVAIFVLLGFSVFSNEKTYLKIIEKLQNNQKTT